MKYLWKVYPIGYDAVIGYGEFEGTEEEFVAFKKELLTEKNGYDSTCEVRAHVLHGCEIEIVFDVTGEVVEKFDLKFAESIEESMRGNYVPSCCSWRVASIDGVLCR